MGKKKGEKKRAIPSEFFKKLATQYPECYFFPFGYGKYVRNGREIPFDPFSSSPSLSELALFLNGTVQRGRGWIID